MAPGLPDDAIAATLAGDSWPKAVRLAAALGAAAARLPVAGHATCCLRLTLLQRWVSDHGRQRMLELLVPATPEQTNSVAVTPTCTRNAAVRSHRASERRAGCQWSDAGPVEPRKDGDNARVRPIAAACRADGDASGCLVLGRSADEDAVDRRLSLAAPVPGFVGFAVGRTLWWEPLRDAFDGVCVRDEAVWRITPNYRRLIGVYLAAQGGRTIDE